MARQGQQPPNMNAEEWPSLGGPPAPRNQPKRKAPTLKKQPGQIAGVHGVPNQPPNVPIQPKQIQFTAPIPGGQPQAPALPLPTGARGNYVFVVEEQEGVPGQFVYVENPPNQGQLLFPPAQNQQRPPQVQANQMPPLQWGSLQQPTTIPKQKQSSVWGARGASPSVQPLHIPPAPLTITSYVTPSSQPAVLRTAAQRVAAGGYPGGPVKKDNQGPLQPVYPGTGTLAQGNVYPGLTKNPSKPWEYELPNLPAQEEDYQDPNWLELCRRAGCTIPVDGQESDYPILKLIAQKSALGFRALVPQLTGKHSTEAIDLETNYFRIDHPPEAIYRYSTFWTPSKLNAYKGDTTLAFRIRTYWLFNVELEDSLEAQYGNRRDFRREPLGVYDFGQTLVRTSKLTKEMDTHIRRLNLRTILPSKKRDPLGKKETTVRLQLQPTVPKDALLHEVEYDEVLNFLRDGGDSRRHAEFTNGLNLLLGAWAQQWTVVMDTGKRRNYFLDDLLEWPVEYVDDEGFFNIHRTFNFSCRIFSGGVYVNFGISSACCWKRGMPIVTLIKELLKVMKAPPDELRNGFHKNHSCWAKVQRVITDLKVISGCQRPDFVGGTVDKVYKICGLSELPAGELQIPTNPFAFDPTRGGAGGGLPSSEGEDPQQVNSRPPVPKAKAPQFPMMKFTDFLTREYSTYNFKQGVNETWSAVKIHAKYFWYVPIEAMETRHAYRELDRISTRLPYIGGYIKERRGKVCIDNAETRFRCIQDVLGIIVDTDPYLEEFKMRVDTTLLRLKGHQLRLPDVRFRVGNDLLKATVIKHGHWELGDGQSFMHIGDIKKGALLLRGPGVKGEFVENWIENFLVHAKLKLGENVHPNYRLLYRERQRSRQINVTPLEPHPFSTSYARKAAVEAFGGLMQVEVARWSIANTPGDIARQYPEEAPKFFNPKNAASYMFKGRKKRNTYPDIVFYFCKSREDIYYNRFKYECDFGEGTPSQCVAMNNFHNPKAAMEEDRYGSRTQMQHIFMKINKKLGGKNATLVAPYIGMILERGLPQLDDIANGIMIVGADVTHPSGSNEHKVLHSIAAVVATNDLPPTNYGARIRVRNKGEEYITCIGEMIADLATVWKNKNPGAILKKVLFFRDGVGDTQHRGLLKMEIVQLQAGLQAAGFPNAALLYLIVKKRHSSRFRTTEGDGNLKAGMVVDQVITTPHQSDFFLCSHKHIAGISRPILYHLLIDQWGLEREQLQTLVYHLCYTYERCPNSLSHPPPVHYAHLAAFRGRRFYQVTVHGYESFPKQQDPKGRWVFKMPNWPRVEGRPPQQINDTSLDDRILDAHGKMRDTMYFL